MVEYEICVRDEMVYWGHVSLCLRHEIMYWRLVILYWRHEILYWRRVITGDVPRNSTHVWLGGKSFNENDSSFTVA